VTYLYVKNIQVPTVLFLPSPFVSICAQVNVLRSCLKINFNVNRFSLSRSTFKLGKLFTTKKDMIILLDYLADKNTVRQRFLSHTYYSHIICIQFYSAYFTQNSLSNICPELSSKMLVKAPIYVYN
jgi:hypothetical protein